MLEYGLTQNTDLSKLLKEENKKLEDRIDSFVDDIEENDMIQLKEKEAKDLYDYLKGKMIIVAEANLNAPSVIDSAFEDAKSLKVNMPENNQISTILQQLDEFKSFLN